MDLGLNEKVVLVTGSTRGIGYAIAQRFYSEGCHVVLNGRNDSGVSAAMASLPGSIYVLADVTVPSEAQQLVAEAITRWGRLDVLVCNVGSGRSVAPGAETPEEWQRVFALNLWSTTNMIAAATEALVLTQGTIVCISSICGVEVIPGAPVTYSAAKAALNAYVRGIARPLGQRGVRINAIAPGNILFEGSVWARKLQEDAAAVTSMLHRDVALRRLGTPEEIAHLVCYLASPCANFTTGALWTLDGGQVRH